MTATDEILRMKKRYAAEHRGHEANVLYISDPKWRQWWWELVRIGNPHVDEKLSAAIGRKGIEAMRGHVWHGLRVERLNPNQHAQYRTFVDYDPHPARLAECALAE